MHLRNNKQNKMSNFHKMTIKDYKNILNYYDIDYSTLTNDAIKNKVHSILAKKLCRCIKKVQGNGNSKSKKSKKSKKKQKNTFFYYFYYCFPLTNKPKYYN